MGIRKLSNRKITTLTLNKIVGTTFTIILLLLSGCSTSPLRLTPGFDQKKIKKIIVFDFKDQTNLTRDKLIAGTIYDQEPGKMIAGRVATYLEQSGRYEMIERRLARDVLEKELGFSKDTVIDTQMLRGLGESLGADGIVVGEVNEAVMKFVFMVEWAKVSFNVRLIDVDSGETAWEFDVRKSASNQFPYEIIDESCRNLAKELSKLKD